MNLKNILFLAAVFTCLAINTFAQEPKITSIYTSLADKKCKTLESSAEDAGSYRGLCPGTAGFKLELLEGDLRQTINVIAPNRKKFELNLWTNVSSAFSSVGDKAEWRVVTKKGKVTPVALIVRFNASENTEKPDQTTSYLVVSKITASEICVTDIVKNGADANSKARELAEGATKKSCRTSKD